MAGVNGRTELTEIAIKATESRGELDGLLLKWSGKVKLDSWVNRKTICREDAQDLKQEVLINIFERFGEFEPDKANFETWCFNRARQIIRSWIRKQIKERRPLLKKGYKGESKRIQIVQMPEDYDAPDRFSKIPDVIDDRCEILVKNIKDNLNMMKIQRNKLEPTYKTLDLLQEGFNILEIADILQTTKPQIKAHIKRIRTATLMGISSNGLEG